MNACIRLIALTVGLAAAPVSAQAPADPAYPSRSITMIVPLAAGSAADIVARLVATKMSADLGRPIVIENAAGASGLVGIERGIKAPPDGYTIVGVSDSVLTMVPQLNPNAKFNPHRDLTPITQLATIDWVLVAHPSFAAKTIPDLLAMARAKPGTIDFSSGGNASPQHVAMEAFKARTGINLTHVPYRGATAALTDVVAGVVPVMFTAVSVAHPFLVEGKLHALATAGRKRSELLPNVPTVAEAGVEGFEFETWMSLMAPANLPKPIADKLHASALKAVGDAEIRAKLLAVGLVPLGNSADAFAANLARDYAKTGEIIRAAGMKLDP
ncbi:MAG TPA: tripartite tricarboxylate transporter substrate-binding protein [Beijerinckiaceae bacterium]|nr:tripartite tricarboxylate transporter substrate-binding protein [Beijerinckiaceae bacterium]